MMTILKRSNIFQAILFLGLISLGLGACGKKEEAPAPEVTRPVKTVTIGGSFQGTRTYPGTVQAADRVDLSFRVGGPVIELPIREGQRVKKGDVLARVDPRDYRLILDKTTAEFQRAESDYERYQKLYESEAVPLADLELKRSDRDVAKANREAAQVSLEDTELRAPFDGEIGEKFINEKQIVTPGETILGLHGVDGVEVVINVPEADKAAFDPAKVSRAKVVATFSFVTGKEFPLTLKEFSSSADPASRTYRATLSMAKPEAVNIQPGMTTEVRISLSEAGSDLSPASITVPVSAITAGDDGRQYAWVIDPASSTVSPREVELGEVTGTESVKVSKGLSAGDRIVIAGTSQLREGMKVRLMEEIS